MKDWSQQLDPTPHRSHGGIVLVGLGSGAETGPGSLPPLTRVTQRLAELLDRPVLELETTAGPDAALSAAGEQAALSAAGEQAAAGAAGWLAGLEIDVGVALTEGRCWAEALGAWRQPAVLVIPTAQLSSGLPAAASALLRQWQVPLVGLLQWGGVWQAEARQRDGLPWLGLLAENERSGSSGDPDQDDNNGQILTAALALRWRQLQRA